MKIVYTILLRKPKYLSIFIFLLIFVKFSAAQDVHFSQFYASPLSLNPASTGDYNGDWRIMNSFRNQWSSVTNKPYNTNALGYDRQFYLNSEKFSMGFLFISDKSGPAGLSATKLMLSAAYHKNIRFNSLHLGVQFAYVSKLISYNGITFPNQFNMETGGFDAKLPSGESGLSEQISYPDVNIGFAWNRKFRKFHPFLGFSFFHLNRPKESFFDDKDVLPIRYSIHTGAKVPLNKKWTALPSVLLTRHTKASEFLLGSNLAYALQANFMKAKAVFAGIFTRYGFQDKPDAGIVIAGMNFKNLDVGISYDVNISALHLASNYKGAFEISVIYTGMNSRLEKIKIPCDRY